jgi:hypothetical protein
VKPCEQPCEKCCSADIHRRYFRAGEDTNRVSGASNQRISTHFVDRSIMQPAFQECIVHICRCCGYSWDTAPASAKDPS